MRFSMTSFQWMSVIYCWEGHGNFIGKFDRHVAHDGHANTYSLTKDGVHHKLKPMIKEGEKVCSSVRIGMSVVLGGL